MTSLPRSLWLIAVWVVLGSSVVGLSAPAGARGGTTDCSVQLAKPWNRSDGYVVGKATVTCPDPMQVPYRRTRVTLWYERGLVKVSRGHAGHGVPEFTTKVEHGCHPGRWRARVTAWFRWTLDDSWAKFGGTPVISGVRGVRRCG
jgi:hypothetical protein